MNDVMHFVKVKDLEELKSYLRGKDKKFILFVKEGSSASSCALDHLEKVANDKELYVVDVAYTKNIHSHFGVDSVPTFLIWEDDRIRNKVKGCQSPVFYKKLISGEGTSVKGVNGKPQKRVVVYSTPTCPYCNKLKQYLNKHGIRYTDVNVASNPQAAEEMVRKSGQRGVPQTDINGQIIIGFDVPKISRLLEIPTE